MKKLIAMLALSLVMSGLLLFQTTRIQLTGGGHGAGNGDGDTIPEARSLTLQLAHGGHGAGNGDGESDPPGRTQLT